MSDWPCPVAMLDFGNEFGILIVYQRCSRCGRFTKAGDAKVNMLGEVKPEDWYCANCEQEYIPDWEWY